MLTDKEFHVFFRSLTHDGWLNGKIQKYKTIIIITLMTDLVLMVKKNWEVSIGWIIPSLHVFMYFTFHPYGFGRNTAWGIFLVNAYIDTMDARKGLYERFSDSVGKVFKKC